MEEILIHKNQTELNEYLEVKALEILRRIKNTPQDIFRYSESDFDKAIEEINSLIKKVEASKSYFDLKLDGNFEEENLNNRSCDNCKHIRITQFRDYETAICTNENCDEMFDSDVGNTFCCNRWESK